MQRQIWSKQFGKRAVVRSCHASKLWTTLEAMKLLLAAVCAVAMLARERVAAAEENATGPTATPPDRIKIAKDFKVELLYSPPKSQGSWVSMCADPKGRLIVSDQYDGGLYRLTPPPVGSA